MPWDSMKKKKILVVTSRYKAKLKRISMYANQPNIMEVR